MTLLVAEKESSKSIDKMKKGLVVLRGCEPDGRIRCSEACVRRVVRYGECQKNHAASIGGHAVDGCREFMAGAGEEGTSGALTCAACGCHRSFHRRLQEYEAACDCSSET